MKKFRLVILSVFWVLVLSTLSTANSDITIMLNGSKLQSDVSPRIINNRILLPVRVITENMGAEVNWDSEARTATIDAGETSIKLVLNSKSAVVNGKTVKLDQSVVVVNNRILVPIRFISENIGARVNWNSQARTAIIEYGTSYSHAYYNSSDENDVIKDLDEFIEVYGQPLREDNAYSDAFGYNIKTLYYNFGTASFVPHQNKNIYILADINSTENLIGTPRDVKIGDSIQSVMSKFYNDENYDLYIYEEINARLLYMSDDMPISVGLVKYDNSNKIKSLEYYTGYFTGGGNSAIFNFKDGKVSSIQLHYGYM